MQLEMKVWYQDGTVKTITRNNIVGLKYWLDYCQKHGLNFTIENKHKYQ